MLLLIFKAGDNQYALETARLTQILPPVNLRPYPGTPDYISGLLNFHGAPVVVVDLSRLIDGRAGQRLMSTRIIIAEYKGHQGQLIRLGLLAEGATTVVQKDRRDFIENALKTEKAGYLGKMFREGSQLIQLVKPEALVPAELENMLANVASGTEH